MKKFTWLKFVLILCGTLFIWACSKEKTAENEPQNSEELTANRASVLANLADNIIIPSYDRFQIKLNAFSARVDSFTAAPDQQRLTSLRESWQEAYIEWQKVELFDVGPGEDVTIRYFFNIYPANTATIEQNFQKATINFELPSSYAAQGFPALDYLINGVGANDQEILDFYTSNADAAKHSAYMQKINSRMNSLLSAVISGWKGGYRNTFVEKTKLDINSSTSLLVNGLTLHYERYIRSGKLGIPSGAMMNGIVAAEKVEAFYKKDISGVLAKTAHQAFMDFFNGKNVVTGVEGPSLKTYLDAIGAKDADTQELLSKRINDQMQDGQAKLNGLNPNIYQEIGSNIQNVKDAYISLQRAVLLIKVDMSSAMSVTITYSDNDGD